MKVHRILPQYNLILIRYNEIWLKSMKVKMRMLKTLMNNITTKLNRAEIPFTKYQLSKDTARVFFFFKSKYIEGALEQMKTVMGIHSFSPALRTSNRMENILERVLEVGESILESGDSFAIRTKRSGTHPYSSQELAAEAGRAVLDHFKDRHLTVNLTAPDKTIFIEVRDNFSYIYTEILESPWGGLPIEPNKKTLTLDVGRPEDLLGGFLLMRRGTVIFPVLFQMTENTRELELYIENWRTVAKYFPSFSFRIRIIPLLKVMKQLKQAIRDSKYICAICRLLRFAIASRLINSEERDLSNVRALTDGVSLHNRTLCPDEVDLQTISLSYLFGRWPIFTPIIGFEEGEIESLLDKISESLKPIDYCDLKPEQQEFDQEEVKNLVESLELDEICAEALKELKELNLLE